MSECPWLVKSSALADGELPAAERASVQEHLATCDQCQQLLADALTLQALAPPMQTVAVPSKRRWLYPAVAAGALAAASVVWLLVRPGTEGSGPVAPPTVALQLNPQRSVDVMFTGPAFRAHRPYEQLRGDVRREAISLATIAELQKAARTADLFAALTVSGDVQRAAAMPEVAASDRAALAIVQGDADAALEALAVAKEPHDVPAQWNYAIATQRLGLLRSSRAMFAQIAATTTDAWGQEARQRADALVPLLDRFDVAFLDLQARGAGWIAGQGAPITAADIARFPAYSRIYFYDAARTATTPAELEQLVSVATALDQQSGNTAASAAVARAQASVKVRAPWVAAYRAVVAHTASEAQSATLWQGLRKAGASADDMLVGAAVLLGNVAEVAALQRAFAPWQDPWFDLLRAKTTAQTQPDGGVASLTALLTACPRPGLELRCGSIAQALAEALVTASRDDEAEPAITRAVAWFDQAGAPQHLANARAFRAEIFRRRGRLARARAEFSDIALTPNDCGLTHYAAVGQANLALVAGDWAEVRRMLPGPTSACPAQPDLLGVTTAVDLARRTQTPEDQTRAAAWITLAQQAPDAELHLVAEVAQARLQGAAGDAALVQWLAQHPVTPDAPPLIAALRAWTTATLISNAGAAGNWSMAMQHANAEAGVAAPSRCHVTASLDDDLLTLTALAGDAQLGLQEHLPPQALRDQLNARVPAAWQTALRACATVDVVARPPLHGRADLLPADLIWQFIGSSRATAKAATPATSRLLIADAVPPPAAGNLPHLAPMLDAPATFDTALRGAEASPSRVTAAMRAATYIEFHVHGVAAAHGDDAAELILSPNSDGAYTLTARQISTMHLQGAPVVVLAACRAATLAPHLRDRWGLPDAFLAAGARAVIAVDVAIPDGAAVRYFAELRSKLLAGTAPSEALAALRKAAAPADVGWISHVMVFAAP